MTESSCKTVVTLSLLVGDRIRESVSLHDRDQCTISLNFVLWKWFYLPCLHSSLAFTTETSRPVSFAVSMENCVVGFYLRQEKALIEMLLQLLFWEAVPLTPRSGTIVEIAILHFHVRFKIFFTKAVCGTLRKGCAARYWWRAIPILLLHLASGCAADKNLIANFWCLMDCQSAVLYIVINVNTSFEGSENEDSTETRIFWKAVREIKL